MRAFEGDTFGDVACLGGVEKSDLLKIPMEKSPSTNDGKYLLDSTRSHMER